MKRMIFCLLMAVMTIAAGYSQVPIQNYEYEYNIVHIPLDDWDNEISWNECYFFGPEVTVQNKKYFPFTNKDTNETDALIRQEGRKAYVLITKEFLEKHVCGYVEAMPFSRFPKEGEELLIWDFETPVGESYEGMIQAWYVTKIGFSASKVYIKNQEEYYSENTHSNWSVREVEVRNARDDVLNNTLVIEGLGGDGYLYAPNLSLLFDTISGYYIYLVSVKDRTDNYKIIYGDENNGVETVTPTTVQDYRMYDLMGREICNPEKGTVYIQNGRKFIAR